MFYNKEKEIIDLALSQGYILSEQITNILDGVDYEYEQLDLLYSYFLEKGIEILDERPALNNNISYYHKIKNDSLDELFDRMISVGKKKGKITYSFITFMFRGVNLTDDDLDVLYNLLVDNKIVVVESDDNSILPEQFEDLYYSKQLMSSIKLANKNINVLSDLWPEDLSNIIQHDIHTVTNEIEIYLSNKKMDRCLIDYYNNYYGPSSSLLISLIILDIISSEIDNKLDDSSMYDIEKRMMNYIGKEYRSNIDELIMKRDDIKSLFIQTKNLEKTNEKSRIYVHVLINSIFNNQTSYDVNFDKILEFMTYLESRITKLIDKYN